MYYLTKFNFSQYYLKNFNIVIKKINIINMFYIIKGQDYENTFSTG